MPWNLGLVQDHALPTSLHLCFTFWRLEGFQKSYIWGGLHCIRNILTTYSISCSGLSSHFFHFFTVCLTVKQNGQKTVQIPLWTRGVWISSGAAVFKVDSRVWAPADKMWPTWILLGAQQWNSAPDLHNPCRCILNYAILLPTWSSIIGTMTCWKSVFENIWDFMLSNREFSLEVGF